LCSFLRWQNEVGLRQRQELLTWQVSSSGEITENPESFGEWLKHPATTGQVELSRGENKALYTTIEKVAEDRLHSKSNQWLHPEGVSPISAAWVEG